MKSFYKLKIRTYSYLIAAICSLLSTFYVQAQPMYASSQTTTIQGVCLLCAILNPNNAVDSTNLTNYSDFELAVGVLGVNAYQTLIFPQTSHQGLDSIIIQVGSGNALLSANLFAAVSVQTANGSTLNNDAQVVGGSILRLLDANTIAQIVIKPTNVFDRVIVNVNSSLLGLLNDFRIYYAQRVPVTPVAPTITTVPASGSIPAGDTAVLTATSTAGSIITWYSTASGGSPIATGSTLSVNPITTTTYYAQATIETANSPRTPVTITVTAPIAPVVSPTSATIPAGDTATFHATAAAGAVITWYSTATGGTAIATGATLSVNPIVTTTYYAQDAFGSLVSPRTPVTVTVTAPVAPVVTPPSATIPAGDTATFHAATAAGATITWYTTSSGGTAIATGATLSVNPIVTTTYYAQDAFGSLVSTRTPVTVTVTAPLAPVVTPPSASIPAGDTATFHAATAAGATITWYTTATGGTAIATGAILSVHPTITTIYYVQDAFGSLVSPRTAVTVTVTSPAAPVVSPSSATIPAGDTATFHAAGAVGSTITWYTTATGGTAIATGSTLSVAPTVTTTYYAQQSFGSLNSPRTPVTVTVTAPVAPVISPASASIAPLDSVTLHASAAPGATITWYSTASGGTPIGTGPTLTVHPTSTTTYYAQDAFGTLVSARTPVTVTVTPPTAPVVSPTSATIQAGDTATFHATAMTGSTITWYTTSTGGSAIATGGTLSVHPTVTTTYYVQSSFGTNSSARTPVVVTVTPYDPTPQIIPSITTIHVGDTITLKASGAPGSVITWYNASTGGTLLFTGTSFTVHPTVTTFYYAQATLGASVSGRSVGTVYVIPAITSGAPEIIPASASIRVGDTITLKAAGASGSTITWYDAPTGGNLIFTGSSLTVHPTTTTTYYAQATIGTTVSPRTGATIFVNALYNPAPEVIPASVIITAGDTTTLQAAGVPGSTISWFSTSTGGTALFTGSAFKTAPITTTTYYAQATLRDTASLRTAVTVTVNPVYDPAPQVIPANINIHPGDTARFKATGATGSTIVWYSAATGGTVIFTGSTLVVTPMVTTTYYAQANDRDSVSPRTAATATVTPVYNPAPEVIPATATITLGDSVTLQAAGAGGSTITWYDSLTGGHLLFTGTPYKVAPRATTMYYAQANISTSMGNNASSRSVVKVTVNPVPLALTANPDSVCLNGHAFITLSNAVPNVKYMVLLMGGTIDTTVILTSTSDTFTLSHIKANISATITKAIDTVGHDTVNNPLHVATLVSSNSSCVAVNSQDEDQSKNMGNSFNNNQNSNALVVAPNPTTGTVQLNANQDLSGSIITVYSAQGAVVSRDNLTSNSYQMPDQLPTGIYVIQVVTKNKQILTGRVLLRR